MAGVMEDQEVGLGCFDGVCVGFGFCVDISVRLIEKIGFDKFESLYPFTNLRLLLALIVGIGDGRGRLDGVIERCTGCAGMVRACTGCLGIFGAWDCVGISAVC